MAKSKTPTYTIELPLCLPMWQEHRLEKKFKIGRAVYNSCLGEALKRHKAVKADKEYRGLLKQKSSKSRNKRLKEIRFVYGFSEYQLHDFVKDVQAKFPENIGSLEAQKLATRAFQAVEKLHFGKAKKVRFKRFDEDISIEGKNNATGLHYSDGNVLWGTKPTKKTPHPNSWLCIPVGPKPNDEYAHLAFMDKTRRVGIDIGTSTIAISSETTVQLRELAPECNPNEKEVRQIQRAMDRSKRETNPKNFNENGTIKKGKKTWNYSNRYKKLRNQRKELYRKMKVKRKMSHEKLANEILAIGSDIRVETMRFQSLAKKAKKTTQNKKNGKINRKKRFGKSIANRAPAMLLTIIERKLGYQGYSLKKIDTYATKASQFHHLTGEYKKKHLSERWNDFGKVKIQRDLYSAFLIGNTVEMLNSVDVELCNAQWGNFMKLHHREIARIKQSASKTLRWFVA